MSDTLTAPRPLPAAALHEQLGADLELRHGWQVPATYGAPESERQALEQSCGLVDRSWADLLEITGEDRLRFVGGQVTCEIQSLTEGSGSYGFFTSPKGRIEADVIALALEDRLWLELPPERAEAIAERLNKYIIADRVEVQRLDGWALWTLAGPKAAAVLDQVTDSEAPAPEELWSHQAMTLAGTEARVVRHGHLGLQAFTLWIPVSAAVTVGEALIEAGAAPIGVDALDAHRIAAGEPRFGADFGPDNFPQETGLDDAVSYTKGCYLGQEVVARLHYRGQVSRQMRSVVLDMDEPPAVGTELLFEGRPAGTLSSVAVSPELGKAVGLSILQRRAFAPGTRLELPDGTVAEVR
ncbi:MAG: glycine cleavage T C-terminal barrel domain-containing protein [Acidobacteriota bacterium]|nr:glycine cleavage T C-terminal barrel domain-containing protein [Acidobacteriota bacterium]